MDELGKIIDIDKMFKTGSNDKNHNSNLDTNYELRISKKEAIQGVTKKIEIKKSCKVCPQKCKECKHITDKIFKILDDNCNRILEKKTSSINVKIPSNIKNGQIIIFKGEGQKKDEQYGNAVIKVIVK